jgi:DNA gyrase/topoisomerase IV subunit B
MSGSDELVMLTPAEAIRRRVGMYIGGTTTGHLVEATLRNIAADTPAPTALRLTLWRSRAFTIAFDGAPLPIEPSERHGVVHPELYWLFHAVALANRLFSFAGPVLNALSEALVVWTVVDGESYRMAFSRGAIVSPLRRSDPTITLGTTWLTFRPDATVIAGDLSAAQGARLVDAASTSTLRIGLDDRSDREAPWD